MGETVLAAENYACQVRQVELDSLTRLLKLMIGCQPRPSHFFFSVTTKGSGSLPEWSPTDFLLSYQSRLLDLKSNPF
jgi:hypothetical protein